MNYGKGIAAARETAGLSKRQLAIRVGLTPGYITYIEAGRKKPSLDVLERIAEAVNVPVAVLFLSSADPHELRGVNPEQAATLAAALQRALKEANG